MAVTVENMFWGLVVAGAVVAPVFVWLLAGAGAPVPPVVATVLVVGALAVVGWRGAAGAWAVWWWPVPWLLTVVGAPLALADVRHRRLPDVLTLPAYPAMALALVLAAATGGGPRLLLDALTGTLAFGGAHLVVHRALPGGMGAGDVKLAGFLGAALGALGWASMAFAALAAAVLSAVLAVRVQAVARAHGRGELTIGGTVLAGPAGLTPRSGTVIPGPVIPGAVIPGVVVPGPVIPDDGAPQPAARGSFGGGSDGPGATPPAPEARDGTTGHGRDRRTPGRVVRCGVPHGPSLVVAAWVCAVFPGVGSGVVPG